MAEIYPDEGLDYIMGVWLKNGTPPATLYVGLFTSQTATTVPARSATGGASPSGWTEMSASSGSYARQSIAAASWGAQATNGDGRRSTGPQVTFTGFVGAAAANGFFIATNSAAGSGDKVLFFANFDSGQARSALTTSDQIKVTPSAQQNG
jgi:hypothetical protein